MQPRITVSADYEGVSHAWYPETKACHAFGTLNFGNTQVHLYAPADIDVIIAELVALRAEMAPPPADDEAWRLTAKGEAVAAAAGPPFHVTGRISVASCGAEADGYICNAQEGHDGPEHVAYGSRSEVCHRWPVTAEPEPGRDEPCSPDAAEALIDAIVAGAPAKSVSA